jgi:glycosyltransferase involved in cell wall biosynthesis
LTPPGDVDALTDGLRTLVNDADLRAKLGEWGRRNAMNYDARSVAPKFMAVYEEAIARFKARKAI